MTVRALLSLGSFLLAPVVMSAPATAQDGVHSDAFVDQIGAVQSVAVVQSGAASAEVHQDGKFQHARVKQTAGPAGAIKLTLDMRGIGNDAVVTQAGVAVADVRMTGVGNRALIAQRGGLVADANVIALLQSGTRNYANLTQNGSGNAIDLAQHNSDNNATITQNGNNLGVKMVQDGGAKAVVVQTGK